MSLFGEDDLPSRPKQSSSLFDDDPKPAGRTGGNSLFADDIDGGDSPWAFPTPKKAGRGSLVKSLLPATDVPDAYIDAFDALLDAGNADGTGISFDGVKKLLADSGIPSSSQSRILEVVGAQSGAALGRNEFNVVFALIGLAQEGDDMTLDSVDERKRSKCIGQQRSPYVPLNCIDPTPDLPIPSVSLPASTKPAPQSRERTPPVEAQQPPTPPAETQPPVQQASTPSRSRAPMRKQSFGDPEADPWGSPDMHRGHNHSSYTSIPPQTNGSSNAPSTQRTTSDFTTQAASTPSTNQASVQPGSLGSEGGWGGYNAASRPPNFSQGLGDGGFGAPSGNDGSSNPNPELSRSIGRINHSSGSEEVITITALSEKEGLFMFQHRNYEVASSKRTSKVVRRYSDFVWLLDCLHKRYPFRQLPLLPPKRVGSKFPCCTAFNNC